MDAFGNLSLCLSAPLMLFLIEIKMVFGGTQKLFARRMTNRECFLVAF